MCTILGTRGGSIGEARIRAQLACAKSRGPDMDRVMEIPGGYLAFSRLSIMGPGEAGMQPFVMGGLSVVCNGEIYAFRPLRTSLSEKYAFKGESDCEVLLPLYGEYGLDMFKTLDAEFALVMYDAERDALIAARDPIGIRPLYYGYLEGGGVIYASEPKILMGLCPQIMPFPPGCYCVNGEFTRYSDIARADKFIMEDEAEVCAGLKKRLIAGVQKRLAADAPLGFLLSGGLDSSLVCAIAASALKAPIRTFAIGMETDAIDLKYARKAAEHIGSAHTEVIMRESDALLALPEVVKLLGTYDITTIRASIGMYLVCKYIREHTDIRVILTGEISDELFGYKYTDFAPDAREFQAEAEKRVREIHMYDVLRADRCISVNSMEARVPFGDLEFVRYVMAINPALKMNRHGIGKYLLRQAFKDDDILPREILWRDKAAFSDAVGHSMVERLKSYAERAYTQREFETGAAKYAHARPFTKESLLYRDLFERYYPNQSHMITDFWMPNRAWKGCDVNDPSARVLANYGASGD